MCSVNEEAIPQATNRQLVNGELKCVKCRRDVPVVMTRVNDAFCQECFLVYAVHKFRSTLGRSRVIAPKDHVLVAYSGGESSSALLHFLQQGIHESKVRFKVSVIHIDELGLVTSVPEEERKFKVEKIAQTVFDRGFPLFLTSLEQAMDMKCEEKRAAEEGAPSLCQEVTSLTEVGSVVEKSDVGRLKSVLDALPSISAKEEFIRVMRNQLLVEAARQRGFGKVVVGDTATLLSVRIMTDFAKGKGGQVSFDTSIGDDRYGDVMVVRPLRELSHKEIETYNRLNKVESVSTPRLQDKWNSRNSIEQLTTSFVMGLQENFPSTVPNIVRTSGKLGQEERHEERGQCAMCQSPLDTNVGEASALHAVEISERLSRGHVSTTTPTSPNDAGSSEADSLPVEDVKTVLCYGCRLMVKGLKDTALLPPGVKSRAMSRNEMRAQIAEFLLDEDCETT